MSDIADTIPELSTTTPLGIGGVFLSAGYYLGEYGSLSVVGIADQTPVNVSFEFSGDNINWDYLHPPMVLGVGGVGQRQNVVIVSKRVRIRVENLSGVPLGYLRVYTYGSVENTALDAIISGAVSIAPIPLPVDIVNPLPLPVDIVNPLPLPVSVASGALSSEITEPLTLVGDLKVSSLLAEIQYMFTKGASGTVVPKTWQYPYSDVKARVSILAQVNTRINNVDGFAQLLLNLLNTSTASTGENLFWTGRALSFRASQVVVSRFQCYFIQGAKGLPGPNLATYMGCGIGYLKPGSVVENFAGFGYNTIGQLLPNPPTPTFQIILNRAGTVTTFMQPSWNIDACDGAGVMPVMKDWNFKNSFEISATESRILFKILSPKDGLYHSVHQIIATNNHRESLLQDFSLSFLAYQEYPVGIYQGGSNDNILGISSFMMGIQSDFTSTYDRFSAGYSTPFAVNSAGLETPLMGIQHNGVLSGQLCYTNVNLDYITFGNTNSTIYKVYRNAVHAGMTFTPGSPADNLNLIPVTQSTFVALPLGPPAVPGICMFTLNVGAGQTFFLDLTKYNVWLDTDDTITVSAFSPGAGPGPQALVTFGYSSGFTSQ